MDHIRAVKAKTSELSNKIRKKVNLLIDAINSQKLEVGKNPGWKLRENSFSREQH